MTWEPRNKTDDDDAKLSDDEDDEKEPGDKEDDDIKKDDKDPDATSEYPLHVFSSFVLHRQHHIVAFLCSRANTGKKKKHKR